MLANLEILIDYIKNFDSEEDKLESNKTYKDIEKLLVKIWDHINLAQQQYTMPN